jgi:TPR repeat protein
MCRAGNGVPRDDDAARRWYREAARAGSPAAEKRLQALS